VRGAKEASGNFAIFTRAEAEIFAEEHAPSRKLLRRKLEPTGERKRFSTVLGRQPSRRPRLASIRRGRRLLKNLFFPAQTHAPVVLPFGEVRRRVVERGADRNPGRDRHPPRLAPMARAKRVGRKTASNRRENSLRLPSWHAARQHAAKKSDRAPAVWQCPPADRKDRDKRLKEVFHVATEKMAGSPSHKGR